MNNSFRLGRIRFDIKPTLFLKSTVAVWNSQFLNIYGYMKKSAVPRSILVHFNLKVNNK